jgi:hypothetical protein
MLPLRWNLDVIESGLLLTYEGSEEAEVEHDGKACHDGYDLPLSAVRLQIEMLP